MELKFTELDDNNVYDRFDSTNYENYWESLKVPENQPKKKKVTFNDILSNMNLIVNNQGVLQQMIPNQEFIDDHSYQQNYQQNYQQTNTRIVNNQTQSQNKVIQQKKTEPIQSEPIQPIVKHSYIYNKYFKDYVDPNAESNKVNIRVPKTKEEYYEMLLDDRKKAIEHKLRIEQIKSKKMLFTSAPGINYTNPKTIQATKNNLRNMNFS